MTTDDVRYITLAELEAGLDDIRAAPKEVGTVRMIVRRPAVGARERLDTGELKCDRRTCRRQLEPAG
jgi:hypothetical protein